MWQYAKSIIPGGNQVLSKRPERFCDSWPTYFKQAKGYNIMGVDGEIYSDFAGMGVGCCALGYADKDVDDAVISVIKQGQMTTLNSPDEILLTEKLLDLHPWAEMARYTRSGGESCAVAVRLARAYTGKDMVLFCGYHGWSDWYLSANLRNDTNLDEHLLKGLNPVGVPSGLCGTAEPFNYGDIQKLEKAIAVYQVAAIIMEPARSELDHEFLKKVRVIADKAKCVLIFDEVTSGFRMNLGGIHMTTATRPDMVVLGKALGNGYPIAAVLGKRDIMDSDSFISSTMWSEGVGFAAALATIEKMEKIKAQNKMVEYGKIIKDIFRAVDVEVDGIDPLVHVKLDPYMQTLYTQEMLKQGFLTGAAIYTTSAYHIPILNKFAEATFEVFGDILCRKVELNGEVRQEAFQRLT